MNSCCVSAVLLLACRDVEASNVQLDEEGVPHLADFGSSFAFNVSTGRAVDARPVNTSNSAAASVGSGPLLESSVQRHRQHFYGPAMRDVAGTALYMAPTIGNLVASDMYGAHVDCYATVVLAMSLLCVGWSALRAVAEPWPAGVSTPKESVKNWLGQIAYGEIAIAGQPPLSAELRDFVSHGMSRMCTAEQLLIHFWVTGTKLQLPV